MFDCVVFDFDGLILDTETPLYVAWKRTFEHFGVPPIDLDEWTESLGLHDDDPAMLDPLARLRTALARDLDDDEVQRVRRALRDDLLDGQPVLPGVEQLLDQAEACGIPVAGKPDPTVYLVACRALDAVPGRSLALEDSPHGTAAAKAAGMTCFAVPTPISRHLDFGIADRLLASLEEITLEPTGVPVPPPPARRRPRSGS